MKKLLWVVFLLLVAGAVYLSYQTSTSKISSLESEIQADTEQLHKLRKEAFNEEMRAQPEMKYHWDKYSQDIQKQEDTEKKILELKKKIEKLTLEKEELQRKAP